MTSLANNELGFSDTEMEEFSSWLDDLRASGTVNMFGAAPLLADAFSMDKTTARKVLQHWMEHFEETKA